MLCRLADEVNVRIDGIAVLRDRAVCTELPAGVDCRVVACTDMRAKVCIIERRLDILSAVFAVSADTERSSIIGLHFALEAT